MKASIKKNVGQTEVMSNKEHFVSQISVQILKQNTASASVYIR